MRRALVVVGFAALVAGGVFLLRYLGGQRSEEHRVREVIGRCERLVEEEDYGRLAAVVWPEYSDSFGMTYRTLLYSARLFFDNVDDVELEVSIQRLEVLERRAEVETVVTFSWVEAGGRRVQDALRLLVVLEEREGHWKVLSLEELPLRFD